MDEEASQHNWHTWFTLPNQKHIRERTTEAREFVALLRNPLYFSFLRMPTRLVNNNCPTSKSGETNNMQLDELFSAKGEIWFKRGSYYYSLTQVQIIVRDSIRVQPENADKILQQFQICKNPPKYTAARQRAWPRG